MSTHQSARKTPKHVLPPSSSEKGITLAELEALQHNFDTLVDRLGARFHDTVSQNLKEHIRQAVAADWVAQTVAAVDDLFRSDAEDAVGTVDRDAFAAQIKAVLQESTFSDDSINDESDACSRELAQLVLSNWIETLTVSVSSSEGVRLNANMLPLDLAASVVFTEIDCQAYETDELSVTRQLRAFWTELEDDAQNQQSPIELTPNLFIVPDASVPHQPYALFKYRDNAVAFLKQRPSLTPAQDSSIEQEYLRILQRLRRFLESGSQKIETVVALDAFRSFRHALCEDHPNIPIFQDSAEYGLAMVIDDGFGQVAANLAAPSRHHPWKFNKTSVQKKLQYYADKALVPRRAVVEVYTIAVASRVASGLYMNELATESPAIGSGMFSAYAKHLVDAHQLNEAQAKKLLHYSVLNCSVRTRPPTTQSVDLRKHRRNMKSHLSPEKSNPVFSALSPS